MPTPRPPAPTDAASSASIVKRLAREAGFDAAGIGPAAPLHSERIRYLEWIEAGRQGEMQWMTRGRAEQSARPGNQLPEARSAISVAHTYGRGERPPSGARAGRVARYTWGPDYHALLGERLQRLVETLREHFGGEHRWYVDTGPQMDKALAARAGIGWYGKNTNVLTEEFGSYVLLGEVITTLALEPDRPLDRNCGSCTLCRVACPTGALDTDYSIDARRCISYLTIEHRGPIPVEYRARMANWVYGCDICQDVCPPTVEPYLKSRSDRVAWARETRALIRHRDGSEIGHYVEGAHDPIKSPDLVWLLTLSHAEYLDAYRGTSIRRAKVWMLRRNAAVALGNVGSEDAVQPLARALKSDQHPLVRGHAAWALGALASRLSALAPRQVLAEAQAGEDDPYVLEELELALAGATGD